MLAKPHSVAHAADEAPPAPVPLPDSPLRAEWVVSRAAPPSGGMDAWALRRGASPAWGLPAFGDGMLLAWVIRASPMGFMCQAAFWLPV